MRSGSGKKSKVPTARGEGGVVHVLPFLDFGGVESHRVTWGRHLRPEEKGSTVFCSLQGGGQAHRHLRRAGCRVVLLGENPRIPNVGLVWKLARLFSRIRPRLVHAALPEANFHAVLAARWAGVPCVWVEETGEIQGSRSAWAHRVLGWVYRMADRVICVSRAVERGVLADMPMLRGKTRVIYNPLACPNRPPAKARAPVDFLAACRLVPEKNLSLFLAALEILKRQGLRCRCWIAGEGPLAGALRREISERNLGSQVTLRGQAGGLKKLFSKARFFVNTSTREGLGLAPMEALAAGLPVLATRVGGVPEWLEPSGGGWLVPPNDPHALARAMKNAIRLGKRKTRAMAARGARYLRRNFSVPHYRRRLASLQMECRLPS